MEWYLKVMKQYADFNGRARRKEYWMFFLFNIIVSFILGAIDTTIGTYGALSGLYALAVFIPSLAVGVRRLHDSGKSGWMLLVAFIPVIGFIWLLILLIMEGTPGENQYGANPKETA
jgi:uncharacterized membrane protein YhaH (DUF805 family)